MSGVLADLVRTFRHRARGPLEALQLLPRPVNAGAEIWRFPDRCRAPLTERL
jgi:hypothetical protein